MYNKNILLDAGAISVIIPLYNKSRHIRRSINSVLAQTVPPHEIIIVDDGSTDGGGNIVRAFADSRIRLIRQSNSGECAARNRGIREASGELIAFLDADDEWLPGFLGIVMRLRDQYPHAGAYATAYRCARDARSWRPVFRNCKVPAGGGLLADYFLAGIGPAPVTSSSVMIPRRIFEALGGFPAGIRTGGDSHMWARIALQYRIAYSGDEGAVYHLSADNRVCDAGLVTQDMAAASAVAEFLQSGKQPIVPQQSVVDYLAATRIPMALHCHLHGMRDWALDLLAKTRGTRAFRMKRLVLKGVVLIPASVLLDVLRFKRRLRNCFVDCGEMKKQ